jgi:hypothetical protein
MVLGCSGPLDRRFQCFEAIDWLARAGHAGAGVGESATIPVAYRKEERGRKEDAGNYVPGNYLKLYKELVIFLPQTAYVDHPTVCRYIHYV